MKVAHEDQRSSEHRERRRRVVLAPVQWLQLFSVSRRREHIDPTFPMPGECDKYQYARTAQESKSARVQESKREGEAEKTTVSFDETVTLHHREDDHQLRLYEERESSETTKHGGQRQSKAKWSPVS